MDNSKLLVIFTAAALLSGCGGGGSDDQPAAPVVGSQSFSTDEDQTLNDRIQVTSSSSTQLTVTSNPAHGAVTVSNPAGPSANFSYVPARNYFGPDAFSIRIVDSQNHATDATISIAVRSVNDLPVAVPDTARTAPGTPVTVSVLSNDSDVETAMPQVSITAAPSSGTAVVNADRTITYTPAAGFAGSVSFQYRITDEAGANSDAVAVSLEVSPTKRVVYLSGNSPLFNMQYYDGSEGTAQSHWVSGECGLQSPTRPNACQRMWKTPGAGGFLFQGLVTPLVQPPPNPVIPPYNTWGYWDNANGAAVTPPPTAADVVLPTVAAATDARLGPTGAKVISLQDVTVGGTPSSRATVIDFLAGGAITALHDTTGADEVRAAEFSPDGASVIYRTNTPGAITNVTLRKVALAQPLSPTTLIGPFAAGTNASSLHLTPNGALLLYVRTNATDSQIRAVETSGSGVEQAVGPVVPAASGTINDFVISPNGRYVAFVTTSNSVAPAAYLADLQTNSFTQIGASFATGTSLSLAKFRGDNSSLMLRVTSATESAVYEAAVTAAGTLTRVSPSYASAVAIPQFEYAGASVVYVADPSTAGIYELFVAQNGTAVRLSTNVGTTVEIGPSGESFRVSDDGAAVLYSQVDPGDTVERVFLIAVTTPGYPTKLIPERNPVVDPVGPVRARGHLPKSLGFDFYP